MGDQGYRLSLLEVQKLAYFLQTAGEPMGLRFEKNRYGPYADDLDHVLQRIEGHFIRGYGDRSGAKAEIHPMPNALDQAREFLEKETEAKERLDRIKRLIEGFETPYGMELLSTIHWIVKHDPDIHDNVEAIRMQVESWNERKKDLMKPRHIQRACSHLAEQGWISALR